MSETQAERSTRTRGEALPRLQVVTPDRPDRVTIAATVAAVTGGARWVQVRIKASDDRTALLFTEQVRDAVGEQTLCIVDDRVDVALAAGVHGVHVGEHDLPVGVTRRILGPEAIVGATARDPEAARRAEAEGATYIGAGPVYASTTKTVGLPAAIGPAGIEKIASAVDIPVMAISGIGVASVRELVDAGAHGVAVVVAVYGSPDPARATAELLAELPP